MEGLNILDPNKSRPNPQKGAIMRKRKKSFTYFYFVAQDIRDKLGETINYLFQNEFSLLTTGECKSYIKSYKIYTFHCLFIFIFLLLWCPNFCFKKKTKNWDIDMTAIHVKCPVNNRSVCNINRHIIICSKN